MNLASSRCACENLILNFRRNLITLKNSLLFGESFTTHVLCFLFLGRHFEFLRILRYLPSCLRRSHRRKFHNFEQTFVHAPAPTISALDTFTNSYKLLYIMEWDFEISECQSVRCLNCHTTLAFIPC